MTDLGDVECRELLASHTIGRIGWASTTGQIILPVNYLYRDGVLGFRTSAYAALADLIQPTQVAFEVDDLDPVRQIGSSVLVRGTSTVARERQWMWPPWAAEITPWASGNRPLAIEIEIGHITGRSAAAGPSAPS